MPNGTGDAQFAKNPGRCAASAGSGVNSGQPSNDPIGTLHMFKAFVSLASTAETVVPLIGSLTASATMERPERRNVAIRGTDIH
jgi:hypothetical protein